MRQPCRMLASVLGASLLVGAYSTPTTPTPRAAAVPAPTRTATPRPVLGSPTPISLPPLPTGTSSPTPAPTPRPGGTPTATPVVRASNIASLTLETFTIPVGTTVVWTNQDLVPHTTTSGTPGRLSGIWDNPVLEARQEFSFTFTQAGEYPYRCRVHTDMIGTVTVR